VRIVAVAMGRSEDRGSGGGEVTEREGVPQSSDDGVIRQWGARVSYTPYCMYVCTYSMYIRCVREGTWTGGRDGIDVPPPSHSAMWYLSRCFPLVVSLSCWMSILWCLLSSPGMEVPWEPWALERWRMEGHKYRVCRVGRRDTRGRTDNVLYSTYPT
jgi:hypothetical protein